MIIACDDFQQVFLQTPSPPPFLCPAKPEATFPLSDIDGELQRVSKTSKRVPQLRGPHMRMRVTLHSTGLVRVVTLRSRGIYWSVEAVHLPV
jgi:hypothetical protein